MSETEPLKLGSLCSGVGGLELGLEWALSCETIWQVEIEPHLRAVLAHHWPSAKQFNDVTQVGAHNLEPVDIICFGSPCQDVSSAGKRLGLSGPKSSLFYECARVVGELGPDWVVVENVASGASRWVDDVRKELERKGYATLPVTVSAADCGAPHQRSRVFIVANADRSIIWEQSGGAAGRVGSPRASLQSIASSNAARQEVLPDAHDQPIELPAQARDRLSDAHRSGEYESDRCDCGHASYDHGGGWGAGAGWCRECSCTRFAPDAYGEFGNARSCDAGSERAGRTEPPASAAANADGARRERARTGTHSLRQRPPKGCWRAPVPEILRMVHGVSSRLDRARDRIAALGNSCTPPQAEVVGNVIRILIDAERLRERRPT